MSDCEGRQQRKSTSFYLWHANEMKHKNSYVTLPLAPLVQSVASPFAPQLQIDAIYENFCALNCEKRVHKTLSFLCTSCAKTISLSLHRRKRKKTFCCRLSAASFVIYIFPPPFGICALCGKLSALPVTSFGLTHTHSKYMYIVNKSTYEYEKASNSICHLAITLNLPLEKTKSNSRPNDCHL